MIGLKTFLTIFFIFLLTAPFWAVQKATGETLPIYTFIWLGWGEVTDWVDGGEERKRGFRVLRNRGTLLGLIIFPFRIIAAFLVAIYGLFVWNYRSVKMVYAAKKGTNMFPVQDPVFTGERAAGGSSHYSEELPNFNEGRGDGTPASPLVQDGFLVIFGADKDGNALLTDTEKAKLVVLGWVAMGSGRGLHYKMRVNDVLQSDD